MLDPYWEWECYKNGMYEPKGDVNDAVLLLSDWDEFERILNKVVDEWDVSARNHLLNNYINRQAWCGQVACCYRYGVGEVNTRTAWKQLTPMQRYKANKVADKQIKTYERKNKRLYKQLGRSGLFTRNTTGSSCKVESAEQSSIIQSYLFGDTE